MKDSEPDSGVARPSRVRVAVVILNWNGLPFLEKFLPSVVEGSADLAQVWVADNASSDKSLDFVAEHFPQVRLLSIPRNMGFAGGYNYALERISAEFVVLLNQDVSVTKDWLRPLMAALDADPQAAAVQPKLRAFDQPEYFEYAGAAGGMMDALGYPFCRGRIFDHCEKDQGQYDDPCEIFWASGAALFIRRELYLGIGGLDEDFFAHMEEIDLCWRLRKAGYKILYAPDSVVWHVGGGSLDRDNPRKLFLNFRNNSRMLIKNSSASRLLWLYPLRMALDSIAALHEWLNGKPAMAKAALEGKYHTVWYFFYWRKKAVQSRIKENSLRIAADRSKARGFFSGSIVWQHFVRGVKRYSDL